VALRLADTDMTDSGLFGEWYFPARPIFMQSAASEIFRRELAAYVRGDVLGRSFLIAAHRGVGKTSLVLRAVADLQRAAIRDVAKFDAANMPPAGEARRPLLVKLTGSALLPPAPAEAAGANPAETASATAESALAQITIALYRALARETAESFTLHAREFALRAAATGQKQTDLPEVAAQLTLDLDLAPELAGLRDFWNRLRKLKDGVLWPRQISNAGRTDRGFREIVALATANQAFRECAGQVSSTKGAKDSLQQEQTVEGGIKIDVKDAVNKLWSLLAGALVGGALLKGQSSIGGTAAAAAAGAATAIVTSAAFGWSASRTRKNERSADYTFIVNHSLATLERDLPVVIDRIRETGLSPVFLIDELDKVDDGCIKDIIGRLKSLTTDYGFFCFLTDRAYYDGIEQKLRREAFPVEHTFFSQRLLIMYRPEELACYVRQLWSIDGSQPQEVQAAWIVTCVVLHRARLNSMDIRREIARICTSDGSLRLQASEICTQAEYLLTMTVQLALEHVLRSSDIRRRMRDDDAFAQLALDVLYMISRAWRDGVRTADGFLVTIDEDNVRADLIRRRCVPGTPAEARQTLSRTVGDDDIRVLTAKAKRLATFLTSFESIYAAILGEEMFKALPSPAPAAPAANVTDSERAKVATLLSLLRGIPGASTGLLAETDKEGVFRFLFDQYGVEIPAVSDAERLRIAKDAVAFFDELVLALGGVNLGIGALVTAAILPASIVEATLARTAAALRTIKSADDLAGVAASDLAQITGLPGTAQTLSRAVAGIAGLAGAALDASGATPPPAGEQVLQGVDRMLGTAPLAALLSQAQPAAAPRDALRSPDSALIDVLLGVDPGPFRPGAGWWRDAIFMVRTRLGQAAPAPNAGDWTAEQAGDRWRVRVAGWLLKGAQPCNPAVDLADIVDAARGAIPAGLLRPDFNAMTVAEWSRFCMVAFGLRDAPGMAWGFAAGLRALGFDRTVVLAAGGSEFAGGAPEKPPGLLHISSGADEFGGPPDPASGPVFVVPKAGRGEYTDVVKWLSDHAALSGKFA
jgi:hypothetical protein